MKLNITLTNEDGDVGPLRPIVNAGTRTAPTNISIPYLSVNPGITFFNNGICNVDSKQIRYTECSSNQQQRIRPLMLRIA